MRHLLRATIFGEHAGISRKALYESVNATLPGPLPPTELDKQVSSLQSRSEIVQLPNGNLKLTEEAHRRTTVRLSTAETRLTEVREAFETAFADLAALAPIEWADFVESFLSPLVSELGAKTYEIVTGDVALLEGAASSREFLSRFPSRYRDEVYKAIATFVNPNSPRVRQYILGLLNTALLVRALTLPVGAVQDLLRRTRRSLKMNVFLDTNVLFTVLGLDVEPTDSSIQVLHDLINNMPNRVDVKLYMLPSTMEEARATIDRYRAELSHFVMNRPTAEAIHQGRIKLGGIAKTYIRETYRAGRTVSARDYFEPYFDNFVGIARAKGVELYNASLDEVRRSQAFLDDMADQWEIEMARPEDRGKSYEVLKHDMLLWHFAKSQRPTGIDAPLDARAWVVTGDYGLLRFDGQKRRHAPEAPPVCLETPNLLQILQLWLPNSEKLEAALLTALRPMPPRIDGEAERVTVRIIDSLSRYENVGDLSEEAVASVVLNNAVRGRIATAKNPAEESEAVRSGVVDENLRLRREVQELTKKDGEKEARIAELEGRVASGSQERDAIGVALEEEQRKGRDREVRIARMMEGRRRRRLRAARIRAACWGLAIATLGSGGTIWGTLLPGGLVTGWLSVGLWTACGLLTSVWIGCEQARRSLRGSDVGDPVPVPPWVEAVCKWARRVVGPLMLAGVAEILFG